MLPGLLAAKALPLLVDQARAPHGGKGGGFWWFCWRYLEVSGEASHCADQGKDRLLQMRLVEVQELSGQGSRLL